MELVCALMTLRRVSFSRDLQDFVMSYIGMATAIGHMVDIPVVIRALASKVHRGVLHKTWISWDWPFLLALDQGDDEDDLAAVASSYHNQWWTGEGPVPDDQVLCLGNIQEFLDHHWRVTGIKEILPRSLVKGAETWAHYLGGWGPPGKELKCEKCSMYRSIAIAVHSRWLDMRHHAEGLEVFQEARRDTAS